jgi:hypothetical protein
MASWHSSRMDASNSCQSNFVIAGQTQKVKKAGKGPQNRTTHPSSISASQRWCYINRKVLINQDLNRLRFNVPGWQSLQGLRCEATRSLYAVVKTSWLTRFQKRVLTEASCGCGTILIWWWCHPAKRTQSPYTEWQSRIDCESHPSQQQAAVKESGSGLRRSKEAKVFWKTTLPCLRNYGIIAA